jgi:hypothetical protein
MIAKLGLWLLRTAAIREDRKSAAGYAAHLRAEAAKRRLKIEMLVVRR